MAGFTDILGSMIQQGMSPSRATRAGNAFGGRSSDLGAVLDSIGQVLEQGTSDNVPQPQPQSRPSSRSSSSGGGLGDIIGSLASNKVVLGGLSALAAAILGSKSKSRSRSSRPASRKSVGGGWMAILASLAFAAMKHAGKSSQRMPRALMDAQTPEDEEALERDAEIIVKAMINAAKADGRIDDEEIRSIIGKLEENGLTEEEKEFFVAEAKKPLDTSAVISSADGRPDMAAQIYAASLLAIEVDTPGEQQYLNNLARGLHLDPKIVNHIEQTIGT